MHRPRRQASSGSSSQWRRTAQCRRPFPSAPLRDSMFCDSYPWRRHFSGHNGGVSGADIVHVPVQEAYQLAVRQLSEIIVDESGDKRVESLPGAAMGEILAGKAANIPVESGGYVVELVKHRDQLLLDGKIEKARHQE